MTKQFNGEMLVLARQIRRVSQEELAQRIGNITQGRLSKIEHGQIQPDIPLVEKFAEILRFRASFFHDGSYRRMPPVSYHRRRKKLAVRDLEALHGLAEVYRLNLKRLFTSVECEPTLPTPPAIDPDQFENNIEAVADVVRQRWAVPRGPVRDVTSLLEKAGVIVVVFDFGTPLIDGFTQHAGDGLPPVMFINSAQPKDRLRFSLAHELGHLVMHHTPNPEMEVQANLFASAFLMPRRDIEGDFNHPSIQRFLELKLYWGTSIQALIYKAWELGRISDRMFKYYNIELAKRGFRAKEPVDIYGFEEKPRVLREILQAHLMQLGYRAEELADMCGLTDEEFKYLYPVPSERPRLRIVS